MALDLSGLERAAARAGLGTLVAREVPPDRRRGRFFRWTSSELQVSSHVLERLRPDDAAALLEHSVLESRELARHVRLSALMAAVLALALVATWMLAPSVAPWLLPVAVLGWLVALAVGRAGAVQRADDLAVLALGDPEPLVRALNTIHQDALLLGGRRVAARPDVHTRAERLVRLHQLRLPPELRRVPEHRG